MSDSASGDGFQQHRQFLVGVAYRMLGAVSEAEDAVQDAYLRWQRADREHVEDPRAYLAQIVTRLCLDRLTSARARREEYVGTWLPEPFVEPSTASASEVAEDLSVALLVVLERLSPLERAAFLLHDVFDLDYAAIATTLERTEAAVRQLVVRARAHVRAERPRFEPTPGAEVRLAAAFAQAMLAGDVQAISGLLAEDAIFYTDGGGKRIAALNPVCGRAKILRFLVGIDGKRGKATILRTRFARINGHPGFVVHTDQGVETLALEISGDRIVAMYGIRNPDKLKHLA